MSTEDIYKQHLNEGHLAALDAVFAAGAADERSKMSSAPNAPIDAVNADDYVLKLKASELATQEYQKGFSEGRAAILAEIDAAAHANTPEIAPQTPQATPTQPTIAEPSPQPQAPIAPVAPGAPLSL